MVFVGANNFGILDYVAVAFTLFFSVGIGVYHAYKNDAKISNENMLLGGRQMKALPIAVSMIVTYLSSASIIGFPAEVYLNGIHILVAIMILIFSSIPIAAYGLMKVLYDLKLTSVYEYLELRFESPLVRLSASFIFIIQVTLYMSIGLYAPSIALQVFLGLPSWISIVGIGLIGTLYTAIGGIKAVIWTDVFQFALILIGMFSIVVRGFIKGGGFMQTFQTSHANGRLDLFNWNIDPFERYNTVNCFVGYGVALVFFYATHQPNVQRYSSLPTFKHLIKAMIWQTIFKELVYLLIILTGLSIYATYAGCDPVMLGEIKNADSIVPYFFVTELSHIPGMIGIFTSCIFSAVLGAMASMINSLAAVTWEDFLSRIPTLKNLDSKTTGKITILLTVIYGLAIISITFFIADIGSIFQICITVFGAFNGTLGGCFLMGLFIPQINKVGAFAGLVIGIFGTLYLAAQSYLLQQPYESLPLSIDNCPKNTDFSHVVNSTSAQINYEWPQKLYTISNVLYPCVGFALTIIFGILFSFIGKFFIKTPSAKCMKYLHPAAKYVFKINNESQDKDEKINVRF